MAHGPSARGSDPRRRGARPGAGPGPRRGVPRQRRPAETSRPARPRFTARAAVLLLVLVLLVASYASSMRAYLDQQRHLAGLRASIASSRSEVDRLALEKKRWQDPAYVRAIAHQRFGWVMPGEIGFQVLDENGKPLDPSDTLSPPGSVTEATRPLWWQSAWGSVVRAGQPVVAPADAPRPATRIKAPKVPHPRSGR